jgi:hypothetical protein
LINSMKLDIGDIGKHSVCPAGPPYTGLQTLTPFFSLTFHSV